MYPGCIPYVAWVSECLQCVFQAQGVASYHKPFNTLRFQLVRPKNKILLEKQYGLVYKVECGVCHKQYIRETERTLGKSFKEHIDGNHPSSAVQEHINLTGHLVTFDRVKM